MYHIEKSIVASLLNYELVKDVDPEVFNDPFHKKLAKGYMRLKELGEELDFEYLRNKFVDAGAWSANDDRLLIELMTTTNPFGSEQLFDKYYKTLEDSFANSRKERRGL